MAHFLKEHLERSMRIGAVVLLCACLLLPIPIAAQTSDTESNNASTTRSRFYWEGSSESGSARRERIRGYRQQSSELQQRITALDATPTVSVSMPVLFGVALKDISPNFGDARSDGRTHEGEDIMAVSGTPVVSPTAAVVLRVGSGTTEGNYVYTANPGGETFVYMHLDRIGEGVVSGMLLNRGALIGYVGNTGNASGGPAHLHFEIHTNGNAVDPFPRLTAELSVQEKISDLTTILAQTSDSTALARFLVTNFRSTFVTALAANITLPVVIIDALASIPATAPRTGSGAALPVGDLDVGSSGPSVVALQKYLIQAASGSAATRLRGAGATGNFGIMTKAALVEYQVAVGISPASGYYGAATRAFIASHPLTTPPPATPGTTAVRDLYFNRTGEDVRTLQKLLNANGYIVALTGSGSPGNETTFFGPATEAAVKKFQIARGIMPAAGYVGPLTRAALASL